MAFNNLKPATPKAAPAATNGAIVLGPAKNWSFSALQKFEQCPYFTKLKVVDKAPQPERDPDSPAARGERLHLAAEQYVRGETDELPRELCNFVDHLNRLRELHLQGKVEMEEEWAYDVQLNPVDWKSKGAWLRLKLDVHVTLDKRTAVIIDYKGLPLDTEIPTPNGFTTMAAISPGDELFDAAGNTCRVVGKSAVKNLPCYTIQFDDTTVISCDEDHLWALHDGAVKAVTSLQRGDKVSVCAPVQYAEQVLPLDPYVLGLWLADGKHTSGEITKGDAFVFEECARRGYAVGDDLTPGQKSSECRTVKGIRGLLTKLGVLRNKHIPEQYLRASIPQRLDLLRGLMDGDGSVNPLRKQVVFSSTNHTLSMQVRELACSLGQRALMSTANAEGFGVKTTVYPVTWRPLHGVNPFATPLKADKIGKWGPGKSAVRTVVSVKPVASIPTQCIAVDSPDNTFLCTRKYLPTHNSGKRFGNEVKHQQQGALYAAISALRLPDVEKFIVEFWYIDQNETTQTTYTRRQANMAWAKFRERALAMTTATKFPAKPSEPNCKFCDFSCNEMTSKQTGKVYFKGTGVCEFDVYRRVS